MADKIKENFFKKTGIEIKKIQGKEIILEEGMFDHQELHLWPDNPRIIDQAELSNHELDESEIEQILQREKISQLKKEIEEATMINEPLLVNEVNWQVFEGNRRLLVNRLLFKEANKNGIDPNPWQFIKIQLVPIGTDLKLIDSYLGTLHLSGKEEWDKYNKAAFLYREMKENDYTYTDLAANHVGQFTKQDIEKSVKTYSFMKERGHQNPEDFSLFELLESNRTLKNEREANPDFDDWFYDNKIKGRFPVGALDVRKMLPTVLKSPDKKVKNDLLKNKIDLESAFETVKENKGDISEIQKIKEFKNLVTEPNTLSKLKKLDGQYLGRVKQDLRTIYRHVGIVFDALDK